MRTRRQAARAKPPEPSAVLLSSDDEATPKPEVKPAKRTPARRQKREKSSVGRTTKTSKTDEDEKKEEEKEQPLPEVEKPLPPQSQESQEVEKPLPPKSQEVVRPPKSQESREVETKQPKPRQSMGTSTAATTGLFTRTYDLRSVNRHQATSRLVALSSDDDNDETSVAGGTPTQKSSVEARMSLNESKFRKRLTKMQSARPTDPTHSSPSVTRRLPFTSAADTGSKEPEEDKEEQQGSTSGSATTEERSSPPHEAIVPSEPSTSEEMQEGEDETHERVPAWMQIARAEVGFAVFVTLLGIVGYFCYSTDHCSHFYH